jgi:hypothetical protein
MSKVSVKIKWLKNKYDVDIMLDEPAEVLQTQVLPLHAPANRALARALARRVISGTHRWPPARTQLFALTGVPPDRQKITAGAKQIKEDTDLKTIGLKDKQVISWGAFPTHSRKPRRKSTEARSLSSRADLSLAAALLSSCGVTCALTGVRSSAGADALRNG